MLYGLPEECKRHCSDHDHDIAVFHFYEKRHLLTICFWHPSLAKSGDFPALRTRRHDYWKRTHLCRPTSS
jgi:hypothetical protein